MFIWQSRFPKSPLIDKCPDGNPVTFGVELEGYVDVAPLRSRLDLSNDNDLSENDMASIRKDFAARVSDRTETEYVLDDTLCLRNGWTTSYEDLICTGNRACPIEIRSPILSGEEGMKRVEKLFRAASDEGLKTNRACGLHVHVSLNWPARPVESYEPSKPAFPYYPEAARAMDDIDSIYDAFWRNRSFFASIVPAWRLNNPAIAPNDEEPGFFNAIQDPFTYFQSWNRCCPFTADTMEKHGTVEYRLKEANGYLSASNYIRFVVAFTAKAAADRDVNPRALCDEMFPKAPQGLVLSSKRLGLSAQNG